MRGKQRTGEHLYADWLLKALGDHPPYSLRDAGRGFDARPAASLRWVVNRVCASCNNGWMADLEADTQPILTPLLYPPAFPEQIWMDPAAAEVLATWATKTALVHDLASGTGPRFEPDEYRSLFETRKPAAGARLSLAVYSGTGAVKHWLSTANDGWMVTHTMQIRHCVMQLETGLRPTPWDNSERASKLRVLAWPITDAVLVPASVGLDDGDLDKLAGRPFECLFG